MFKKGEILFNKKNPTFVVLILETTGEAKVLESNKYRKGEIVECSNPKYYEKVENTEKYLKDKITLNYKKEKNIKIPDYL